MQLSGQGLVLRPWTDDDLGALPALFDDPEVARWTPIPSPFDSAAARVYLDQAAERARTGEALQWAVTTDGVRPLGEALLFDRGGPGTRELGYVVGPSHRGLRLASRAVRLVGDHALGALGARRIVLRIDPGNVASTRVAVACGYLRADGDGDGGGLDTWQRVDVRPA
jgi:RimJ/RimL family protein N-acetyltransferase